MKTINFAFLNICLCLCSILLLTDYAYCGDECQISLNRADHLRDILKAEIDDCLMSNLYRNIDVGIQIESVDGKHKIYSRNFKRLYIPASAVKVFTSAIVLIKFGTDYRFSTPLLTDGLVKNGVLEGNLYFQGRGDPALTNGHLLEATNKLKEMGIKCISGDIIYDVSFLEKMSPRYPPNARHYYAPPGAITVNFNWLDTELEVGPPLRLLTIPETGYARLDYHLKVLNSDRPGRPNMTYRRMDWGDYYVIRGVVTRWDKKYKYLQLCVTRPGLFGATLLKESCEKVGIMVKGRVREGRVMVDARELYIIKTPCLINAVIELNRESNNVVAEILNMDMGAYFDSEPGTVTKGLEIITRFCIEKLGFKNGDFKMVDASGLSKKNQFSPVQFTTALNYFYRKLGKVFVDTLAHQGYHHHALHPVPPKGIRIYVKSGTLSATGVNCLVGYIFLENRGEAFSFSILANRRGKGGLSYSGTYTNSILTSIINALEKAE